MARRSRSFQMGCTVRFLVMTGGLCVSANIHRRRRWSGRGGQKSLLPKRLAKRTAPRPEDGIRESAPLAGTNWTNSPQGLLILPTMTDTERAILQTLRDLETAAKSLRTAEPKPDLRALFTRLDELT